MRGYYLNMAVTSYFLGQHTKYLSHFIIEDSEVEKGDEEFIG